LRTVIELPCHAYHVTLLANWPSIQERGLICAIRLIDQVSPPRSRAPSGTAHRGRRVVLESGVVLNDQAAMPPSQLTRCLVQMTPSDSYSLVNSKVFLWLDLDRARRFRCASLHHEGLLLTVDVNVVLSIPKLRTYLTPINTGFAHRRAASRARSTFVPVADWLADRWRTEATGLGLRQRRDRHGPVDLVVDDGVPNLAGLVGVRHLDRGENV